MKDLLRKKEKKNINMFFIFLGPPGSGKGTQSKILAKKFKILHLSTGDILRKEKNSKLGKLVSQYINVGKLVPDKIMIDLLAERMFTQEQGQEVILDGFPRTKLQAEYLDTLLKKKDIILDKAVYFCVDKKHLIGRISGRIVDARTGDIYHCDHNPPATSKNLARRFDDGPDKINTRLQVYETETTPIIDYYKKKDILIKIDANRSIEQVSQELIRQLFPT